MVENKRHGFGELVEFKKNMQYQGQFYQNKRHGQGVQRYGDGSNYTGIIFFSFFFCLFNDSAFYYSQS
jgi:hypothetical protein